MRILKKRLAQVSFAVGLLIASIGLPAIAQTRSEVRQGLPGRRISGGTRDECASAQPVVALTPAGDSDMVIGDRASLQFLLPEFKKAHPVEFKLRDSQGATVYTETLNTGVEEEKLVNIQVPAESLQANQNYHWFFSVVCNPQERSQNIVLSGQLETGSEMADRQIEHHLEASLGTEFAARHSEMDR